MIEALLTDWQTVAVVAITAVGMYVAVVILTRALGVSDYGRYTLTVGAVLMLQGILGSLLGRTTVRFLGRAEDPDSVATAALRLHMGLGILLGGGVFLTAPVLAPRATRRPISRVRWTVR